MALSLKDLQEIMAPLTELGKGEATFEVTGISITIRTLSPEEEIAVQRHARGALTEGDANDQINAMDYLDRFRSACLGYAIVQIGKVDFRGMNTVETGDVLPNGVAVKVKKHEAIMQVIEAWSRPMTTAIFGRYTSLMERIESTVDKNMKYDDDHIEAEISRLEERLVELRATRSKKTAGDNDPRDGAADLAADKKPAVADPPALGASGTLVGATAAVTWETASQQPRSTDEAPSYVAPPSEVPRTLAASDGQVLYDDSPAPQAAPVVPAAPVERKSVFGNRPPVREAPRVEDPPAEDPLKGVRSSLVDTDDPDVIEAENRRLMEARARRMAPVAPHLSAREAAKAIEQSGSIGGLPVFKMPTQDLTPDTVKPAPRTPPPVVKSSTNPNFRPAK